MRLWRPQPPTSASVEDRPDAVPPDADLERSAPEAERCPPDAERSYVAVKTHEDLAALAAALLDPERRELAVVMTARVGEREPTLDAQDVRTIVGPSATIYFLLTGRLTVDLRERVPDGRGPYNGSLRTWLPGVSAHSHPREHPQVFDPTGEYGPRSLRQLAYGLREAHLLRDVEPEHDPVDAHRTLEIIRVIDEADATRRGYEEQLNRAHKERDEAIKAERLAERRARLAERDGGAPKASAEDPEGALRELILARWLETLSLQERARHPLGRFTFSPDFVRAAEGLSNLVRERLTYVCAMIACERVEDLAALAHSPLPPNSHAHHSPNGDQATWQCSLTRVDSQTPPAVRYLKQADGTLKFTGMGTYRTLSAPER